MKRFERVNAVASMDISHADAVRMGAVEMYFLGSFPSLTQAQLFEVHFFNCVECAAELRTMAVLAANGRGLVLDSIEVSGDAGANGLPWRQERGGRLSESDFDDASA